MTRLSLNQDMCYLYTMETPKELTFDEAWEILRKAGIKFPMGKAAMRMHRPGIVTNMAQDRIDRGL